jgi:hypothetical protein
MEGGDGASGALPLARQNMGDSESAPRVRGALRIPPSPSEIKKWPPAGEAIFIFPGGDGGIRTHDTGISRMHP